MTRHRWRPPEGRQRLRHHEQCCNRCGVTRWRGATVEGECWWYLYPDGSETYQFLREPVPACAGLLVSQ
jgi:hypothetical protein